MWGCRYVWTSSERGIGGGGGGSCGVNLRLFLLLLFISSIVFLVDQNATQVLGCNEGQWGVSCEGIHHSLKVNQVSDFAWEGGDECCDEGTPLCCACTFGFHVIVSLLLALLMSTRVPGMDLLHSSCVRSFG